MNQHETTKYENIATSQLAKLYPDNASISIHKITKQGEKIYVRCWVYVPVNGSDNPEECEVREVFLSYDLENDNKIEILDTQEVEDGQVKEPKTEGTTIIIEGTDMINALAEFGSESDNPLIRQLAEQAKDHVKNRETEE